MSKRNITAAVFLLPLLVLISPDPVSAKVKAKTVIKDIRRGNPRALANISFADFRKVHNYKNQYYYIPRRLGQKSVRSLLGCFQNSSRDVRKLCADNLYQLRLTYVHQKLVLHYLQKESFPPLKLALQDLLVRINSERFAKARRQGDGYFMAKVKYDEFSEFVEKGYPNEQKYTTRDIKFLLGGLKNTDSKVRTYAIRMLGRTGDKSGRVLRTLKNFKKKGRQARKIRNVLDESIRCLNYPDRCPDLYKE